MPLHRHPGATRGDAHLLVVVAGRAAGGEGVAQPEAVLGGDAVGDVGEARRALVGGHHQVGVVAVVAHHLLRRHHLAFEEVVGKVQQAADEQLVAGDGLGLDLVTAAAERQATGHEATLGTHRHDHRILHLLRLDQAEHLGAEVLLAIRPAQPAARHRTEAQVHALDARRIDEDLEQRHRSRYLGDRSGAELDADIGLALPLGVGLVEIAAQRGEDRLQVAAQDAVLVEHRHPFQRAANGLHQPALLLLQRRRGQLAGQVEACLEQAHQLHGDGGVVVQRGGDVAQVEADADLLQVAAIGAQQRHLAPGQPGAEHQAVEGIVLGVAGDDVGERLLAEAVEGLQVDHQPGRRREGEVVDPVGAAVTLAQPVGILAQHPQAEVLQDRQHVGERQRLVGVVDLAAQLVRAQPRRLVEAHHQALLLGQAADVLHVRHRRKRLEALPVAGRETRREARQQVGAARLAEALDHQAGELVLPGTAGADHLPLQLAGIEGRHAARIDAQDQLHAGQHRFGEIGPELAVGGIQALHQQVLDLHADLGGIVIARHIDQAVDEVAVGILAQEQAQLVALLDLHDGDGGLVQRIHRRLEQLVARQHLQHLGQLLAQVGMQIETGTFEDRLHLAAHVGNARHALGVQRRGVQADEAAFADHLALLVQHAQRHQVGIGRAVHVAGLGRLGEAEQARLAQERQGRRLDAALHIAQAAAQQPRQAQQRALVVFHPGAARILDDAKFLVAQEGEVIVQQPLVEGAHLGHFRVLAITLRQVVQQAPHLVLHGGEVAHRQAHLAQHLAQQLLQVAQLGGAGAAVDLQEYQRFAASPVALAAARQDVQQLAVRPASHAEHAVLQGVDAVPAPVERHAHRIHQERHVRMQHLHHAVRGLPAVLFVVGVERPHHGLATKCLQQPPGGQGAAFQVAQAILLQLLERRDGEELFGEAHEPRQRLGLDMPGQGVLKLLVKIGLAGCTEERHGDPWRCDRRSIVTGPGFRSTVARRTGPASAPEPRPEIRAEPWPTAVATARHPATFRPARISPTRDTRRNPAKPRVSAPELN